MLLNKMFEKGKVLIVPDLHLRDSDFKTIGGYVKAVEKVIHDIIAFCKDNEITIVILLGDVFDKGYRYLGMSHSHRNLIQELHDVVNGNLFSVLGNHFFLERDNNPMMYLMQPNPLYKPTEPIYATKPIIEVPEVLVIGCMQFSFFHFSKEDKAYYKEKLPGVQYHHGLYHDDLVIPNSIRKEHHIHKVTTSDYLRGVFGNIDMASVGHLHTPIGSVRIKVNGKTIPMDIPGSMCIVANDDKKHNSVRLPVYTITEVDFTKEYHEFNIYTDTLKFRKKAKQVLASSVLSPDAKVEHTSEILKHNTTGFLSLHDFLVSDGCSDSNIRMIKEAAAGTLTIPRAVAYTYGNEEAL